MKIINAFAYPLEFLHMRSEKVSSIARWPEKRLFFSKKRPKQHEGRDQHLFWKLIVDDFADLHAVLPAAPEDARC